jgi:G3E family GTPase
VVVAPDLTELPPGVSSAIELDLTAPGRSTPVATAVPAISPEQHLAGIDSASMTITEPVEWAAFAVWLSALLHAHGDRVLRVKAVVDTDSGQPVVVDGVQQVVHPPRHLEHWDGPRHSSVVLITRDLQPAPVLAAMRRFITGR